MLYIFENDLPENKPVVVALRSIYGISHSQALAVCKQLGFSHNLKVNALSREQVNKLSKTISSLGIPLGSDLRALRNLAFKKQITSKSYKGLRRKQGLPARGQRTHTNAKTSRNKF